MGTYLGQQLAKLSEGHPSIGQVRGMGLFWALDLVKNRGTKEPLNTLSDKIRNEPLVVDQVAGELMKMGVAVQAWISHLIIAPPLIIEKQEIDMGIGALDQALHVADKFTQR